MHFGWVIKGDVQKLMALLLICALILQKKEADSCANYKLGLVGTGQPVFTEGSEDRKAITRI